MASLGDKLVHLSLEIEDRTKSGELLRQLIHDQSVRHESEVAKFEKEQEAVLQKLKAETEEIRSKLSCTNESLMQRKKALEREAKELAAKKEDAENAKKKNLDEVRRDIAGAKECAYNAHKQERSQREKAWFDGRVAQINKLTWKGIQPNIDRLVRKHKEQCDEIKSKTQFSKQKLELQCENDLSERIQSFRRSKQQSNSCLSRRTNFANMLLKEQNDRAMSLMKLKDKFMKEEESAKELRALQLETLAKDHDVALTKIRRSNGTQQTVQQLAADKDARKRELESRLERISNDANSSKAKWEDSWIEASALRMEKKHKQKVEDLLEFRTRKVNELIKRNILDQANKELSEGIDEQLAAEHEVSELEERLDRQKERNKELRGKLSSISMQKARISEDMTQVERDLKATKGKLSDLTNKMERKRKQHKEIALEASDCIEQRLQAIKLSKDKIQEEIKSVREKYSAELNNYHANRDKLMRDHEAELQKLESYATKSAREIDGKLHMVQSSIKEKSAYLSRAQSLLSTRYKGTK